MYILHYLVCYLHTRIHITYERFLRRYYCSLQTNVLVFTTVIFVGTYYSIILYKQYYYY